MIDSQDEKPAIGVVVANKLVRIILCEIRPKEVFQTLEMMGQMDIPVPVYLGQVKLNWHFDELKNPTKGVALDVNANGANFVFMIATDEDAVTPKGNILSFKDIKDIFKKYHPHFRVTKEC